MKLLMITRKVDRLDALAGFTFEWVAALASSVEKLTVITWQRSSSDGLPSNVELISLRGGKFGKVISLQLLLLRSLRQVDGVFCHMNPEYTILAGLLTRLYRKRLVSWYTHKAKTWRRMLMEVCTHRIVTASAESFRDPLFPSKVAIIGHGIDTDLFRPGTRSISKSFNIITVGRISPSKQYEVMIEALASLPDQNVELHIIGDVILDAQRAYLEQLKNVVKKKKLESKVIFHGWVPHRDTARYYQEADLFINLSTTGSLDKAVLEAMSAGCMVLTSNEAFRTVLPAECVIEADPRALAKAIEWAIALSSEQRKRLTERLRNIVVDQHALDTLGRRILALF